MTYDEACVRGAAKVSRRFSVCDPRVSLSVVSEIVLLSCEGLLRGAGGGAFECRSMVSVFLLSHVLIMYPEPGRNRANVQAAGRTTDRPTEHRYGRGARSGVREVLSRLDKRTRALISRALSRARPRCHILPHDPGLATSTNPTGVPLPSSTYSSTPNPAGENIDSG